MLMAVKRGFIVALGFLLQIAFSLAIYLFFIDHVFLIHVFFGILGILLTLDLVKNSKNYSYTLPLIIVLILFPLLGVLLIIILSKNLNRSKILKNINKSDKENKKYLVQDLSIKKEYENNSRLRYISDFAGYPVTKNNDVTYYKIGEEGFEVMLEELKKAKKYIFFEYFIVAHGKMWGEILKILEEKASKGVDVRVMYDDLGCLPTLKKSYPKELEKKGIKCVVFNKLSPLSGIIMNNRDHRKILVIDGKVAFSGGINISDEYINIGSKYGHWKDNAIRICGDAVWNYSVMFLTMWNAFRKEDDDFTKFKYNYKDKTTLNGYVAPYGETPLDEEITGEDIYLFR